MERTNESAGPAYPDDTAGRTLCAKTTVLMMLHFVRTPTVVTRGSCLGEGTHQSLGGAVGWGGFKVYMSSL